MFFCHWNLPPDYKIVGKNGFRSLSDCDKDLVHPILPDLPKKSKSFLKKSSKFSFSDRFRHIRRAETGAVQAADCR
jgi:hypothetical protein